MAEAVDHLQDKYKRGSSSGMSFTGVVTDINSALELGKKAFQAFNAVVTPIFDEMDRVDEISQ
jgi:phage-related tail protein